MHKQQITSVLLLVSISLQMSMACFHWSAVSQTDNSDSAFLSHFRRN